MFAAKDTRSGKFLTNFSGSFNHFKSYCHYRNKVNGQDLHNFIWNEESPNNAKLYKTKGGLKNSLSHHKQINGRYVAYLPDWLEVVTVNVSSVGDAPKKVKELNEDWMKFFLVSEQLMQMSAYCADPEIYRWYDEKLNEMKAILQER